MYKQIITAMRSAIRCGVDPYNSHAAFAKAYAVNARKAGTRGTRSEYAANRALSLA
jgi:hypothetical protein